MTVRAPDPLEAYEPDVDGGVIKDAKARQLRHRLIAACLAAAIAGVGGLMMGFGGGGGRSSRSTAGRPARSPEPPSSNNSSARSVVLLRGLLNPKAYAADGRLWVIQQTSPPGSTVVSEIMRVDPATGRILAVRNLDATYDQALLASGVLWVTSNIGRTVSLRRLAPDSLTVISESLLPGSVTGGQSVGQLGTLAVAERWLWVGGWDTIDRVSLSTTKATIEARIPGAQGVDVAANPSGSLLLDSAGDGDARVQRRNPQTGALLAQSPVYAGVTKPVIGGITGNGIWLSEATGMMGYAQRISAATLRPTPLNDTRRSGAAVRGPIIEGTNGITARVMNHTLWVTQQAGGRELNYCGSPADGRPAAPLPQHDLLAVDAGSIFYANGSGIRQQLVRGPLNPRCRGNG